MYRTTDFYLACYLRCRGYELKDLRREDQRVAFLFEDRPSRRATVIGFYNNKGEVRPLSFAGTIKDMKALIHNT